MKLLLRNRFLFFLILFNTIVFLLLISLVSANIIKWPWLVGYILGVGFALLGSFIIKISIKDLTENLNPYMYFFLTLLRMGIYLVPFLISFYLPQYLSIFGLLLGISMVMLYSIYNTLKSE